MAVLDQPWFIFCLFMILFLSVLPLSSSQSNPQNIETFYAFPIEIPYPSPSPTNLNNSPISSFSPRPAAPPELSPLEQKSSSNKNVVKAVAATAASTFVASTLLFFIIRRFVIAPRRRKERGAGPGGGQPVVPNDQFARVDGNLKPLIVDENGLDVLYWRKLEGENKKNSFHKEVLHSSGKKEEKGEGVAQTKNEHRKSEHMQEAPLRQGLSSSSHDKVAPEIDIPDGVVASTINSQNVGAGIAFKAIEKSNLTSQPSNPFPPPPPLPSRGQPSSPQPQPQPQPPPSPPPPPTPPLPLPPSMANPNKQGPAPPRHPPIPGKNNSPPPPPPPNRVSGLAASSKLPPASKEMRSGSEPGESSTEGGMTGTGNGQVKLKPLHWDKVNKNTGHSMVWDKIDGGSFRFDDDLMEALFGYVATNRRSPERENNSSNSESHCSGPPAQMFILDARKSQNTAIVLKSLSISRKDVLDSLTVGHGLNADTLEKLSRIAPTSEEQSQILEYNGDPSRLAVAESFLYHLLKPVPTAFPRINAMLFRSNYDAEILQFKESLQIFELGCQELRKRGLFMKLLEAILKAGNRMNVGTARGNAKAFKLASLRKLSDVKSTDGKTTLLHFVVEEVVRCEGKRCVINRNRSLSRSSSQSSDRSIRSENSDLKEEREKEYIILGLPVVGGLSAEFSNVKKAAQIDYDTFAGACAALTARTAEVQKLVSECSTNGSGGFAREMQGFLEAAEEELKVLREEQTRIMALVKKTTEYYQAGASKDQGANPLQLFVTIKDFLGMVDQVCVEIARNLQRRKKPSSLGSSPKSPAQKTQVRFPNLPEHFLKEQSRSSSSESDSDF